MCLPSRRDHRGKKSDVKSGVSLEKLLDCAAEDVRLGHLAPRGLVRLPSGEDRFEWRRDFKIAIVGSGPAGLSAAAHAAQLGLSHVLLEKTDHLSDTIYKYQKGKHVMATPSQLVLRSDLDFEAGKREKILGTGTSRPAEHKVNVKLNAEVEVDHRRRRAISRSKLPRRRDDHRRDCDPRHRHPGQSEPGALPGRRGLPHVQYQLDDPGEYIDEHIIVIGAGDAGIENALGLAADPEQRNTVTIVNRSRRIRHRQGRQRQGADGGRGGRAGSTILRETTASADRAGLDHLRHAATASRRSRCDRVIARMGSAPPRAFVEGCCAHRGVRRQEGDRAGTGIRSRARPLSYPKLSPTFEIDRAGHLRDRRARRLSADQALHEPGL